MEDFLCPCCSGEKYSLCCKKYHDGEIAKTPTLLMKSRFSAYALSLPKYIMETTSPLRQKCNTTSSLYINSTISEPNMKVLIMSMSRIIIE